MSGSIALQEVPEVEEPEEETEVLSDEYKQQLGELQLFKNKEGNVSIEVSHRG